MGLDPLAEGVLLINGQPVDGFMGALPEGQIKAFLDKHVPSEDELDALAQADEAQVVDADCRLDTIATRIDQLAGVTLRGAQVLVLEVDPARRSSLYLRGMARFEWIGTAPEYVGPACVPKVSSTACMTMPSYRWLYMAEIAPRKKPSTSA